MNLLHLDSSILGDASTSRRLSAEIAAKFPTASITYRDLAANPLPHLTTATFGTPEALQVLNEFKSADVIVIGAPMYNFGIPSQLKAWIDRVAIAGETFRYTESGSVGLMGGKRVIVAAAQGGHYDAASPIATWDHQTTYLRNVFAFMGIPEIEVITAPGLAIGPESKASGIAVAQGAIQALNA